MKKGDKVLSIVFNELTNDNRVLNQAFSLVSNGYNVTLLGIQIDLKNPLEETINRLKIRRVRLTYKNPLIYRVPFLKFFYRNIDLFFTFFRITSSGFDVIHCHDLNTLQYGVRVKLFKGKKVKLVYDAHEYETQRNGLHGWWWRYVKIKERFLIRFCDRVITVSETIADEYVRLYGIKRPAVILNCPILRTEEVERRDLFREKFGISTEQRIYLYQGYLYPGRGIEVVLKAFDKLNLSDSVLIFMGEGTLTDYIRSHEKFGKSVFIHPFVSGEVLLGYTSSADCGIAFIEDISLSDRYCLPNKLFEYIAAGLPVITSGLPDLKKFIAENKVGVSAPTNDESGFIEAFKQMSDLDSEELDKHINKARSRYNWSTQEKVLFDLYKKLLSDHQ